MITLKEQAPSQIIDVAQFPKEWEAYPEGARVKTTFVWPKTMESRYPFCRPSWLYMFKTSRKAYPEQFWVEIFAYQLGCLVGVPVPPAFVAYDSNEKIAGALIGNTDRHQGNWGIIVKYARLDENTRKEKILVNKMSPAFDNGTSMGHEIYERNFHKFNNEKLEKYVNYGKPHLMWDLSQERSKHDNHENLIRKMVQAFPDCRTDMISCLQFSEAQVNEILQRLICFEIEPHLSSARAKFMLDLLLYRQKKLLLALDN